MESKKEEGWHALNEWKKVCAAEFNKFYEENGPDKRGIEEMRTNLEYEVCIVQNVIGAYDAWIEQFKTPGFSDIPDESKVRVISDTLNDSGTKYGWYRGNLPETKAIKRALRELKEIE